MSCYMIVSYITDNIRIIFIEGKKRNTTWFVYWANRLHNKDFCRILKNTVELYISAGSQ